MIIINRDEFTCSIDDDDRWWFNNHKSKIRYGSHVKWRGVCGGIYQLPAKIIPHLLALPKSLSLGPPKIERSESSRSAFTFFLLIISPIARTTHTARCQLQKRRTALPPIDVVGSLSPPHTTPNFSDSLGAAADRRAAEPLILPIQVPPLDVIGEPFTQDDSPTIQSSEETSGDYTLVDCYFFVFVPLS